jgi:hypothetical protein
MSAAYPWARHTVDRTVVSFLPTAAGLGAVRTLLALAIVALLAAGVAAALPGAVNRWWPVPAAASGALLAGAALSSHGPLDVAGDAGGWEPAAGPALLLAAGVLIAGGAVWSGCGRHPVPRSRSEVPRPPPRAWSRSWPSPRAPSPPSSPGSPAPPWR